MEDDKSFLVEQPIEQIRARPDLKVQHPSALLKHRLITQLRLTLTSPVKAQIRINLQCTTEQVAENLSRAGCRRLNPLRARNEG